MFISFALPTNFSILPSKINNSAVISIEIGIDSITLCAIEFLPSLVLFEPNALLTMAVVPILIAKKTGITACTGAFPTPTELIATGPNLPTITISKNPSNV